MKNIMSKKLLVLLALLLTAAILTQSCGTDRDGCPGKITRSNAPVQHPV
jgi:hypothetical protein